MRSLEAELAGSCDVCRGIPAEWFDSRVLCRRCVDKAWAILVEETLGLSRKEAAQIVIDLELRSRGIGGSEVAAVLGVDTDEREMWSVYNRKVGLEEPEVDAEIRMRRSIGKDLEQAIVRSYTRMTGHPAEWFDQTFQHPDRPWQIGSPDALSPTVKLPKLGVEAKNVAFDQRFLWGSPDDDDDGKFPARHELQARWYMSLMDVDQWAIIALLGGSDLRIYNVERDMRMERNMLRDVESFWIDHVVPRVPPEINYSRAASDYAHAVYPLNRGIVRAANEEERELLKQYRLAREVEKAAIYETRRLETTLKLAVGDDEGLKSDELKFTWKMAQDSHSTDWKGLALELWNEYVPIDEIRTWAEHRDAFDVVKPGTRRIHLSGAK